MPRSRAHAAQSVCTCGAWSAQGSSGIIFRGTSCNSTKIASGNWRKTTKEPCKSPRPWSSVEKWIPRMTPTQSTTTWGAANVCVKRTSMPTWYKPKCAKIEKKRKEKKRKEKQEREREGEEDDDDDDDDGEMMMMMMMMMMMTMMMMMMMKWWWDDDDDDDDDEMMMRWWWWWWWNDDEMMMKWWWADADKETNTTGDF